MLAVTVALAARLALGDDDTSAASGGLVYFDVLGLFVVSYPAWAGIVINSV